MINYKNALENITAANLRGFFVDWPNPPSAERHLDILENSDHFWLAVEEDSGNVIGFITAISDKVLSAYIPLLEVLPEYKNKGIGSRLVELMLDTLSNLYMIDLLCDEDLTDFYKRFGMYRAQGMFIRNYDRQSGN